MQRGEISGSGCTTKHGWLEVDQGSVLSSFLCPIPVKFDRPVRGLAFTKECVEEIKKKGKSGQKKANNTMKLGSLVNGKRQK
jgi:hypothetical protein